MRLFRPLIISLAIVFTTPGYADNPQVTPPKPSVPPNSIPGLETVDPVIICGNCDQPFDTSTHKAVLDQLVSSEYIGELRKALYVQDSYHQFESKAHFDNCDFDQAVAYIDNLLFEVDVHVAAAKAAKEKNDNAAFKMYMLKAFFALGQALHGVQDFYAHTNYVELSVGKVTKETDIDIVSPWTQSGKDRIKELSAKGLVSGYVFWGVPQKCPQGSPSHADMAKDKATTKSGSVKVPHLQNRSRYQIAVRLAREASQKLIDYAFERSPLLKEANGESVAFEILVDRRGL